MSENPRPLSRVQTRLACAVKNPCGSQVHGSMTHRSTSASSIAACEQRWPSPCGIRHALQILQSVECRDVLRAFMSDTAIHCHTVVHGL